MEHERITTLLRETPAGVPSPEPDHLELARRIRRRRTRKLATASAVAALATAGLVLPLSQLAGISHHSQTGRTPPVPAAGGSTQTPTNGPATLPDTGSFACTANGAEVSTPEFAVQADGVHLHVDNPGGLGALVISSPDGRMNYPVNLSESSYTDETTPYIDPGSYEATCTQAAAGPDATPSDSSSGSVSFTIADPAALWTAPVLGCSQTTERGILTGQVIDGRDGVPPVIRTVVNGVLASDEIVPAAYPQSEQDVQFLVQRDGTPVAVVRLLARQFPAQDDPPLDVTSCDGSGIGDGQAVR